MIYHIYSQVYQLLFFYDIHSFSVAKFSAVGGASDLEQLSRRTNKSDGS